MDSGYFRSWKAKRLSPRELKIWQDFNRDGEEFFSEVADDVEKATGLSGPEFRALVRLEELGEGQLRQQELALSLGWRQPRLPALLTKLQSRGFLERVLAAGPGATISITQLGREILATARPVHVTSLQKYLREFGPRR
jgi:DNA-binding MarR family transcriptional regulator